jgi:hypothetical protein
LVDEVLEAASNDQSATPDLHTPDSSAKDQLVRPGPPQTEEPGGFFDCDEERETNGIRRQALEVLACPLPMVVQFRVVVAG